jgi:hypothetical protein
MIENGGIRHLQAIDWFEFNPRIYDMLCQFAQNVDAQPVSKMTLEQEISLLMHRYYKLLEDEMQAKIAGLIEQLEKERRLLEEERKVAQEAIIKLNRKVAMLEYRLEEHKK